MIKTLVQRYPNYLGSSAEPTELALTIKGILLGMTPLVLMFTGAAKVNLGEADWQNFVELIYQIAVNASLLGGGLMTLYGLGRKVYYKIKK